MGKKTKREEKIKAAATKIKGKGKSKEKGKGKEQPLAKKGLTDKPEPKQKELQKQLEKLRKEYMGLAIKNQGIENLTANLLDNVSQLQRDSREIKEGLALEINKSTLVRDRLDGIEMQEKAGLDELSSLNQRLDALSTLNQRLDEQVRVTNEVKGRLETVEQLASKGERIGEQIEQLQAGMQEMDARVNTLITSDFGVGGLTSRLDGAIQRLQESEEQNQIIETRMGNLDQAGADFSQQLDLQQEQIHGLMVRAEKLDQAAREETESYQVLRKQIRALSSDLASTEKRLLESDAELEKKSQDLDSEYSSLANRHGRLAGGVLAAAVLILVLGGVGYWFKFHQLVPGSGGSSQQIAQISERIDQQERRLAAQEQQFSVLAEDGAEKIGAVSGNWDTWLEQFSQNQAAVHTRLKEFAQGQDKIAVKVIQIGEDQDEMRRDQEKAEDLFDELAAKLGAAAKKGDAEGGADRGGAMPGNWGAWLEEFSQSQATMHAKLKEFARGQEDIAAKVIQIGEEQDEMRRELEKAENLFAELATKQGAQEEIADASYAGSDARNIDWIQGLNPKHYTIQIAAAYDKEVLFRTAEGEGLRETMAIYKRELRQRDWYMLLYGDFLTAGEAKAAIQGLPENILANGPWIRKISSVHGDLAK